MENKLNLENVHTVQIEGQDVEVARIEDINKAYETNIGSVTEKATKEARTNVQRDFSKTLGVNLFDDNAINTFLESQKNMVSKDEVSKYTERIAALEPFEQANKSLQFDNAILKNNVDSKQVDKVKTLADIELQKEGTTYEQAVAKVIEDFPFFKTSVKRGGLDPNYTPDGKTGYEKAVSKYVNNPYYKK